MRPRNLDPVVPERCEEPLAKLAGRRPAVLGTHRAEDLQRDAVLGEGLDPLDPRRLEEALRPVGVSGDDIETLSKFSVQACQSRFPVASDQNQAVMKSFDAVMQTRPEYANRISYVFDLRGPSLTVDTACSSSLVALHHACEAIRGERIASAIVGGINLLLSPYPFLGFCRAFSD